MFTNLRSAKNWETFRLSPVFLVGHEPMESAENSGQLEGWNQILDKLAAVVTSASAGEISSRNFDGRHARDLNVRRGRSVPET